MEDLNFENFVENLERLKKSPEALEEAVEAVRKVDLDGFRSAIKRVKLFWPCVVIVGGSVLSLTGLGIGDWK